jgi:molybdopterin-guanine dinucleotide biosynthesis protein A
MIKTNKLIGVVLAGGLSCRMRQDKAMLMLHGRSLLQHQVNLLTPLCARVLVSGAYPGFDCVPDSVASCGPLGGIYSVAMQYPTCALLIIPVDMPQLCARSLQRLSINSMPSYLNEQPLPAFFPNAEHVLQALQNIFGQTEQRLSIRYLHQLLGSQGIYDANCHAMNVNTPDNWQDFLQVNDLCSP